MFEPRFPFVTDEPQKAPVILTDRIGTQTVYACPHCKTGALRFAQKVQYEGGYFKSAKDEGHHVLNLSLLDGSVERERVLPDPFILEMLRIPVYCKQCRDTFALVFRAEAKGHLYCSLEDK
jgi:uncharacterized protein YbaR (Trm112 family)